MYCPKCGSKNEEKSEKCGICGHDLRKKRYTPLFNTDHKVQCPECFKYNEADYQYCIQCGNDISSLNPPKKDIKIELLGEPKEIDEKYCPICGKLNPLNAETCECEFNFNNIRTVGMDNSKIKCPYCDNLNEPDYNYCIKCGYNISSIKVENEDIVKENMGQAIAKDEKFCPNCGNASKWNSVKCPSCDYDFSRKKPGLRVALSINPILCPYCHSFNENENNYCYKCGYNLKELKKSENEVKKVKIKIE